MSMQLAGHGLSTTSTRKRKSTVVLNDTFKQDFNEYNKLMRRLGSKTKTFEQYVQYRKGKSPYTSKKLKASIDNQPYRRPVPVYESGVGIGVSCPKKSENVYTGDKLMGIATMHKSNMVPVFKQEDAEEIAKMRR